VRDELGDRPIIVSLANGIENQRILPKLFSKVIYDGVVHNARRDAPVVVGFQDKGPLLIGTLDNTLGAELEMIARFSRAVVRPRSSTGCRMWCTPRS
jgi:ketopantoate reductase